MTKLFNLDIPRMGYFILFRNEGGFVGNQIVKAQSKQGFVPEHSQYTHIEVSGGGEWSVAVTPPKIKVVSIIKRYPGRYIRIVRYKDDNYKNKRYKVAFWASSNCNLGYDWFGVLAFKIRWLFSNHKRLFFCSENALWALQKEFPKALGIEPEDCMPASFCLPDYFETIWEGEIPE